MYFRELAIAFLDAHPENTVTVKWTPGHEGITGNEMADELAKEAAEDAPPHRLASRAAARREARERAHAAWTAEWKKSSNSGRFATANRLPPSEKPRKHFKRLKREVFGRVLQCRTGHGFTGEYYRIHVPTEPDDCPCGSPFQTRQHIPQDCPRYDEARHILRDVSEHIDLPTILGTEKGIAALAEFITKSGAFTKTGELRAHEQSAEQAEGIGPDAQDDEGGDPDRVGEVEHSDDDEDAR